MYKNKFFVIINVLGLGIALACVIVAYSNFEYDRDHDSFQKDKDLIYKVSITKNINGHSQQYSTTPIALGPAIKNSISGVDKVVRYIAGRVAVRYKENIFNRSIGIVDNNFFDIFDLPMIEGDKNSIKDKSNVLISEKLAKMLFGDHDPLNEMITLYSNNKNIVVKVSGIFTDLPDNTTMWFDILTSIDNHFEFNNTRDHSWKEWASATFIKVSDKERIPLITEQLKSFVKIQNDARKDWLIESYFLENFKNIHNTGRYQRQYQLNLGFDPVFFIFSFVMALIILMLASLNFMNTFLAISNDRLKEIGINKVLGGIRQHSIIQFFGENIILCIIALLFALSIAPLLLDAWCSLLPGLDYGIEFISKIRFWLFLIGILLLTGILAGIYPAFYISSFSPVKILKGTVKYKGGGRFSKILLALQFFLATLSIVAVVIFTQNAYFQKNFDLGYNVDNIIVVPCSDNSKLNELKNKMKQNPLINSIGISDHQIQWNPYTQLLRSGVQEHEVKMLDIGRGYFETMGIRLKEGRYFDQDYQVSERGKAIIVNEKLLEEYGWETAVGQRLRLDDTTEYKVIGLMEDFYLDGFDRKIGPVIFKLGMEEKMDIMVVKADVENLEKVNEAIRNEWEQIVIDEPYTGFYQKKRIGLEETNNGAVKVFLFFGCVSILLSLAGLYSLVTLNIIKRTKEIGIRKVLGISTFKIINLINKDFIYIVLLGSILGSIMGSYLTLMLLNSLIAYHVGFSILSMIVPVLFILMVSIITLSRKVYKAANLNPVDSLKCE